MLASISNYLTKALYGLKIAPKQWYKTYSKFMKEQGFQQCSSEPCMFYKDQVYAVVHVDDTLSTGPEHLVEDFRTKLRKRFKSGEGGDAKYYLGARIDQANNCISLDQSNYTQTLLEKFKDHLGNHNKKVSNPLVGNIQTILQQAEHSVEKEPDFPYREMVGSLVYLSTVTRFDIAAAVSIVSKYLANPTKIHCDLVRRIYWYLRSKPGKKLVFKKNDELALGYCDSSFANMENYESLGGYVITLGGTPILWKSLRLPVTLSTSEAEYVTLTPAIKDCVWLKGILNEIGYYHDHINICEDNQGCMALANNPQSSRKTRHIQVRYHWIRERLQDNTVRLIQIATNDQLADVMTKGLYGPPLNLLCSRLNLVDNDVSLQGGN
jgi:hypothetical protein